MKIYISGDTAEICGGVNTLSKKLGYEISPGGLNILAEKAAGDLEIIKKGNDISIKFAEPVQFFRGLSHVFERCGEEQFEICETPQFKTNGAMFDVSRVAVLSVAGVKELIMSMALMGLNMFMLYTEEMYTIDDEPYFGYMRGRYTYDELCECDDFAAQFGIEIIPCIQTLGHMGQFLKWPAAKKYADTANVLLADDEAVYEFIEKAMLAASKPFRSRRIHVGMDEANDVGLGKYLSKNGFCDRFDIMNRHLARVTEIAQRNGLLPMLWSDMYFHLASKTGMWYEAEDITDERVISSIPEKAEFVYWDYYHEDKEFYTDFIRRHKKLGKLPVFAGGVWIWTSYGADYEKTFTTTNAALEACKSEGVSDVFATVWMNAVESSFPSALLGLQLYAEHGYAKELDPEKLRRRTKICTGIEYEDFTTLTGLYKIDGQENRFLEPPNPSSPLLWQDVLMGLYDADVSPLDLAGHYKNAAAEFEKIYEKSPLHRTIFEVPKILCEVLAVKGDLGIRLKKAYDANDKKTLEKIAGDELLWLQEKISELHEAHRRQWLEYNKAFGFELLDIRYGGLIMRLSSARKRIADYLCGEISEIEELCQKRLPFDGTNAGAYALRWRKYGQIASPHHPMH